MSKEERKQKRESRKANRKSRKQAFDKFIEAVKALKDLNLSKTDGYKEKFMKLWPAIKPTLEFAITLKFTGQGFDTAAQEIIALGENIYKNGGTETNKTEFLKKLMNIWEKIEIALEIIKYVTNDKVDAVIDRAIEIGEWLFED